MHPVAEDYSLAERQSWLRAVPVYEFVNGMAIAALSVRAGEAVEDSGLRDLEVWQSTNGFSDAALSLRLGFRFITCGLQRHRFILQPARLAQSPGSALSGLSSHGQLLRSRPLAPANRHIGGLALSINVKI